MKNSVIAYVISNGTQTWLGFRSFQLKGCRATGPKTRGEVATSHMVYVWKLKQPAAIIRISVQ